MVTTTDESGKYELPDLAPGTYAVEVQMFGFQTARKEMQIGPGSAQARQSRNGRSICNLGKGKWRNVRGPQAAHKRATGRLPRHRGKRSGPNRSGSASGYYSPELGKRQRSVPGERIVEQRVCKPARMISDCAGLCWASRVPPAVSREQASKASQVVFQALGVDREAHQVAPGLVGQAAVADSAADAAVADAGGGFGGPGGQRRNRPGGNGGFIGNRANRGRQGIHGNSVLQWQGSDTDAKSFSLSGQPELQPNFNNYRWSGVLGGPLRIPHLLKGDSTFFTVSYFGTRGQSVFYNVGTVPTAAERMGNFSDAVVNGMVPTIYDPQPLAGSPALPANLTAGSPFPGNMIPSSLFNTAAVRLLSLNLIPLPNLPGAVQNYDFVTAVPADTDNVSIRLNQNLGKNDRLALNESFQRRKSETAQLFGFLDPGSGFRRQHESELGSQRRLERPQHGATDVQSQSHHAGFLFSRTALTLPRKLGIQGTSQEPINYGPPTLSFTNFASLTDALPSHSAVAKPGGGRFL